MKSTIERLAELAKGATRGLWQMLPEECDKPYIRIRGTVLGGRYKVANVLTPVYDGVHEREAKETRANAKLIAACNPTAIQQCAAEFAAMRKRADSAEAKSAELIAQMQEMVRIAAAKHRPAYDEQQRVIMGLRSQIEAAERREQVLREALNNARAQVVAWQGEPHEYSCTIHKAVVSQIDEALAQSQEVRNG